MANSKIKQNRALREVWFNRLRELYEIAEASVNDVSYRNVFKVRFSDIDSISAQFERKHFILLEYLATIDGADMEAEEAIRSEFDRIFYLVKEKYKSMFEVNIPPEPPIPKQHNVKLPKIDLPKFDGTIKDWPSFFDLFKALIHDNASLSDSEKFQYLLSCLSKEPLNIVKAIPLTAENYAIAFKTLVDRFQNIRLLASTYWQEILDTPKLNSEFAPALRKLLNCFSENLDALKNLNLPVASWSFVLFHTLIKKVDSETVKRFELQNASTDIPSYTVLFDFLLKQCTALESVAISAAKERTYQNSNFKKPSNLQNSSSLRSANTNSNSSCFVNATNSSISCINCQEPHPLYKCPSFANLSPLERYTFVKQNNLCLNCLLFGHRSSICKSQSTCRICHSKHHTYYISLILHQKSGATSSSLSSASQMEPAPPTQPTTISQYDGPSISQPVSTLTNILPINTTVLLSTALIEVMDSRGNFQTVRALLDSASQASFITSSCCNRLGLPRSRLSLSIHGLGHMSSEATAGVSCNIRPRIQTSSNLTVEAIVLPKICAPMPTAYIPRWNWPHLSGVTLADPNFNVPSNIDILLGADVFPSVMLNGQVQGGENQPSAFHTIFGWVLIGKISC